MLAKSSADNHLAKRLSREIFKLGKSQAVCLRRTKGASRITSNEAAKVVSRRVPQQNKMYIAATAKPMKDLASQPKQPSLFTVSLIFHRPLG